MFEKYLDDYYRNQIALTDILERENAYPALFYRFLKDNGLKSREGYLQAIDTGDKTLNYNLRVKYNSLQYRARGLGKYKNYSGANKPFVSAKEWCEFCNERKPLLLKMWNDFIESGKDNRLVISIDRMDNDKGYTVDNLAFETMGYNSWKRNVRPLKVTHKGESRYFFSAEEASRAYGLNEKGIGNVMRGHVKYDDAYDVKDSTIEEVLNHHNLSTIQEYYETILER